MKIGTLIENLQRASAVVGEDCDVIAFGDPNGAMNGAMLVESVEFSIAYDNVDEEPYTVLKLQPVVWNAWESPGAATAAAYLSVVDPGE